MKKKLKTKGQLKKSVMAFEKGESKKDMENRMETKKEMLGMKKGKK